MNREIATPCKELVANPHTSQTLRSTDVEDADSCSLGFNFSARVRGDRAQPLRILRDSLGCGFSARVRGDRAQPLLLLWDVDIYVRRHLN